MGHRKPRARISGTGSFTPPHRMTNADFEKIIDTSDEWITTRTGIKERRIARNGLQTSDMALEACRRALDMAVCPPEDIDVLIVGTVTPDYPLPSTACVIQEKLAFPNAVAFDIAAACAGFISGLSIARSMIESGTARKALVCGAEKLSTITDYSDRGTCVLFGDGAGAAVLEASDDEVGVVETYLRSDGSMREWLWIEAGGSNQPITPDFPFDGRDKILMNGSDIFKVAVREMTKACVKVLDDAGVSADDIALVVPHQANIRIIEGVAKRLQIGLDRFYLNIDRYGNTSAASVPLALDEANRNGRIRSGDYILMVAFGGGLIWGAALVKW
ncbi:beta-ketoacyl-ACP synthase III [candidate division GN15 bacterium]|nr:beta-ketoacyl-ACP synthase III [candidate division GN15 bacterium]